MTFSFPFLAIGTPLWSIGTGQVFETSLLTHPVPFFLGLILLLAVGWREPDRNEIAGRFPFEINSAHVS